MNSRYVHGLLLRGLLTLTLTCAPLDAFPEPQGLTPSNRAAALAGLEAVAPERRAEAVAWVAVHGRIADQPLLLRRLRDENQIVRGFAEQGLWRLWSRSGDAAVDRLM